MGSDFMELEYMTIDRGANAYSGKDLEAMLFYNGEKFQGHAAGFFSAGLPFLRCRFAGVEITGEDGLADLLALADFLDLLVNWVIRQDSSNSRMVASSIVPALYIPVALLWMASQI